MRVMRSFSLSCLFGAVICGLVRPAWADPAAPTVTLPSALADPVGYCARIGTIDVPTGGGSPIPVALQPRVRAAVGLTADAPFEPAAFYWRCMRGAVYVCAVGANLPCGAKANRAHRNAGAERFCRAHRDLGVVPAYVTGHDTLYSWSCTAGHAVRGKAVASLDARGYRTDIWHRLELDSK
jgi:hypothetical protein